MRTVEQEDLSQKTVENRRHYADSHANIKEDSQFLCEKGRNKLKVFVIFAGSMRNKCLMSFLLKEYLFYVPRQYAEKLIV
jgi:hypothetical protein